MIKTFADKTTAAVFANERVRKIPPDVLQAARRKLVLLDQAVRLDDLCVPPGNRLEALSGDRAGQHKRAMACLFSFSGQPYRRKWR